MNEAQASKRQPVWKQLIGIAFAVLFLWLAFRGMDPAQFWNYLKEINLAYVALMCCSGIFSHVLRTWRWMIMMDPLVDRKISFWNTFCALMLGYAVNIVIPRGGEVARLVSISKTEKLPWMGVLSTVFIDRLLDIAMLVLLLGGTLVLFPTSVSEEMNWLIPGGISLSILTIIGLILLPRMADIIKWVTARSAVGRVVPENILISIKNLSAQFGTGTKCLTRPVTYPAITLLTLGMWFCYWLNFYLIIQAFGLGARVSPVDCLIVFTIGSIGVLVPTPGAVGSFHFLVSQSLILLCGLNKELALAYATVLHALAFVFTTCIPAAICISIQSAQGKTVIKESSGEAEDKTESIRQAGSTGSNG